MNFDELEKYGRVSVPNEVNRILEAISALKNISSSKIVSVLLDEKNCALDDLIVFFIEEEIKALDLVKLVKDEFKYSLPIN